MSLCWLSLVAVSGAYSLAALCRLLITVASLVPAHRLQGMHGSVAEAHGLSSCISWVPEHSLTVVAQMWHLPRSEVELMSLALAGGFFITELPGRPNMEF